MTAYHVTPAKNLASIMEYGLIPRIGERAKEYGETEPCIYLFPDLPAAEDAISNWFGDEFDESESFVVLSVSVLRREVTAKAFELQYDHRIPPEAITVYSNNE